MKHLFFDLDRTLWDFESNSHETLEELFYEFELAGLLQTNSADFIENYKRINEELWARYRLGELTQSELRKTRWNAAFAHFSYENEELGLQMGKAYIDRCPRKTRVFPGTYEILTALRSRYSMHIITNGFKEVQFIKLTEANLIDYFDVVVTSDDVGVQKPNAKVFLHALELASARADESVMIGDDLAVDCHGAIAVGMKAVWFNPGRESVSAGGGAAQIAALSELLDLY